MIRSEGWFLAADHDGEVVGTYVVRLQVRADRPLTPSQLARLDGGRHDVAATGKPRGLMLEVTLTMAGGDVVGALARSLNAVLAVVPGSVRDAHVAETRPRSPTRRRR
jgi:hypothetical protein